jgi:quercetin dioxygenase-like cupin family protein
MPTHAVPTVQVDTPEARVTEWRLAPGSATGRHRHEYDYVVVPMTDGTLSVIAGDGRSQRQLEAGQSYFRKAGVEHDVRNETAREIVFVEVEIKR